MKIYRLEQGGAFEEVATMAAVGTESNDELCPECTRALGELIAPLQIEWHPGTDFIGDFSWSGGFTFVVKSRVVTFLRKHRFEASVSKVEVLRPTERPRRGQKLVPFPYTGPKLHWVTAKPVIPLNEKASHVHLESHCSTCGMDFYNFVLTGIVIDQADWKGAKMFRIRQFEPSDATFVSEEGRDLLATQEFSNLKFVEAGRIRSK